MRCDLKHRAVLKVAATGSRSFLEIGVQDGGSLTEVLIAEPRIQNLLLCDTWCRRHGGTGRGDHKHIEELLFGLGYRDEVKFLDGRSQDTVPRYSAFHNGAQFDLSHVDGSHDYEDALMDLENAWKLTAKRMVVHDVSFGQVWKAVNEFGGRADAEARVAFGDLSTIVFERRKE